jgi:hypothetical protein
MVVPPFPIPAPGWTGISRSTRAPRHAAVTALHPRGTLQPPAPVALTEAARAAAAANPGQQTLNIGGSTLNIGGSQVAGWTIGGTTVGGSQINLTLPPGVPMDVALQMAFQLATQGGGCGGCV